MFFYQKELKQQKIPIEIGIKKSSWNIDGIERKRSKIGWKPQ
jgi:hypothetical protein